MMKHTYLLTLLGVMIISGIDPTINALHAQTISPDEAQSHAMALQQRRSPLRRASRGNAAQLSPRLAYTSADSQHTYYYAFNYPEGGYAIIGGDAVARQVLGYSTEGAFCIDSIPDALSFMLHRYEEEIAFAIENDVPRAQTVTAQTDAAHTRHDIEPLLTTEWGQSGAYSSQLPHPDLATGCVATAVAQVMKYYNYPTHGIGSHDYYRTISGKTYHFEADFENTTYDWEHMRNEYKGEYTEQEAKAVGTLMYHVGVAVDMMYGFGNSGAFNTSIKNVIDYFGYSDRFYEEYLGDSPTDYKYNDTWEQFVYNYLRLGHPLLYMGNSGFSGHCFVCDGYDADENLFHFNMGWNGGANYYYTLSAVVPTGSSVHKLSYKYSQSAYVNFYPPELEPEQQQVMSIYIGGKRDDLQVGKQMSLYANPFPYDADNYEIVWSSSDPKIATVSQDGIVTAHSPGTVNIYVDAADGGGAFASWTIQVFASEGPVLSGQCGPDIYWEYTLSDKQFHFTGTGSLYEYNNWEETPWYDYKDSIQKVVIDEGITSFMGKNLTDLSQLTFISFPSTFTDIYGAELPWKAGLYIQVADDNPAISDGGQHNILIDLEYNKLFYSTTDNSQTPEGIKSIGDNCFRDNQSESISIPQSVTSIGYRAFYNSQIRELFIPKNVKYIYGRIIDCCKNLTSIIVDRDNTSYDSRQNCNAIISTEDNRVVAACPTTVLPSGVTKIDDYIYAASPSYQTYCIPEGVSVFGSQFFGRFTTLRLSSTLTKLNNRFYRPQRVYAGPTPFSLKSYTFYGLETSSTLYVPQGCLEAYQTANEWNKFPNIREYCDLSTLAKLTTMLYTTDVSTHRGESVRIPICLKSDQEVTAFSAQIELPVGVKPVTDANGHPLIVFDTERCGNGFTATTTCSDSLLTISCQTTGAAIKAGEGVIASIPVEATLDAAAGNQMLQLQELSLTTATGQITLLPFVSSFAIGHFLSGDVNQDGRIDKTDVEGIAAHIQGKTPKRFVEELADPNHDGKISVADIASDVDKMQ